MDDYWEVFHGLNPIYGYKGTKKGIYCAKHKHELEGLVDIKQLSGVNIFSSISAFIPTPLSETLTLIAFSLPLPILSTFINIAAPVSENFIALLSILFKTRRIINRSAKII